MKVVIIGGGLAGLVAAYKLSRSGCEVCVFEREPVLGGMLASYHVDGYFIEKYYHHLFESDTALRALIDELGLGEKLLWIQGTTGYYTQGLVYPLNTPVEILRYPELSPADVFRLACFVFRARRIKDPLPLDCISAKDWLVERAGSSVFENFFAPLLKSKFGENMDRVSAAWLLGRVQIRSNRGKSGELLGYLAGGFHQLVDSLREEIIKKGGKIECGSGVDRIIIKNGVSTGVEVGGLFVDCDAVVSTVPPFELGKLCNIADYGVDVTDIKYQGSACMLLALKKPLMKDTYWLNIKPDAPFGAVIEHTNFLPREDYGSVCLVYLASYFQSPGDSRVVNDEKDVAESFIKGLEELFPDFDQGDVLWWRLSRNADTAPVYEVGYRKNILPYETPVEGLYLAGMFSLDNYPERSMNGSVKAGLEVAGRIIKYK